MEAFLELVSVEDDVERPRNPQGTGLASIVLLRGNTPNGYHTTNPKDSDHGG